jgi:hypothetical protein
MIDFQNVGCRHSRFKLSDEAVIKSITEIRSAIQAFSRLAATEKVSQF